MSMRTFIQVLSKAEILRKRQHSCTQIALHKEWCKLLQKLLMLMKKLLSTKNYFKKCFHAYMAFLAEMYSFLGLVLSWENWMTPSEYNDVSTVPIYKQNYIIHYNQSAKWICKRLHTYSIMEWNITWINNWRHAEIFSMCGTFLSP